MENRIMNRHVEITKAHRAVRWVKRPELKHSADTQLAAAAVNAIECLTTVPTDSLRVFTRDGWLHLEGTVNYDSQRTTIEDVTRHLPGVLGLIDSITIQSAPARAAASADC